MQYADQNKLDYRSKRSKKDASKPSAKHSGLLGKVWRITKRTPAIVSLPPMQRGADAGTAPLRRGLVISAMSLDVVPAILGLSVAACTSIGPSTVPHDRIDYATAIGNSWKEQTLLNIVKLRYADMPIFLAVDQVIAGYQLQSAVGGSFTAGNFNAALVGPFTASGSATATGTYTDRPTVIYSPLTGVDFLKRLMTPVPPSPGRSTVASSGEGRAAQGCFRCGAIP